MVATKEENNELDAESGTNEDQACKIIRRNMYYAMGAGVIPIPLFDLAAVSGLQMKMLYQLSKVYGVAFPENLVKSTLASLVGGVGAVPIAFGVASSFAKFLPGLGHLVGAISLPATSGAITYAIGKTFVMHFESGGTFLSFNAKKMKEHFAKLYKDGVEEVGKDKAGKEQAAA